MIEMPDEGRAVRPAMSRIQSIARSNFAGRHRALTSSFNISRTTAYCSLQCAPATLAAMRDELFARAVTTAPTYSRLSRQKCRNHPDGRCERSSRQVKRQSGRARACRSGQSTWDSWSPRHSRVAFNLNARCRKGRDIAEVAISDTGRALSLAHRNVQRHATASAGCRGSSAQARSGRHRQYRQWLRPAQTR
jgi:hypothetical protein